MTSNSALRRTQWFRATGRSGLAHRSWMRSQGLTRDVFDGRPVLGIATTWSELAPCNVHLHRGAESVKRGVWQSGGFPLEFPAMALGETLMRPTAMLYRNLLAMEAEELIRANPLDGVVLLSGCDKTTPGLLMAAASVDLPAIMVTGGPKLNGKYQGTDVGSGTAVWRWEEDLVERDLRPSAIMTRQAFENAIRVNAAIGGSTNAVVHLLAIAGRLGVPLA